MSDPKNTNEEIYLLGEVATSPFNIGNVYNSGFESTRIKTEAEELLEKIIEDRYGVDAKYRWYSHLAAFDNTIYGLRNEVQVAAKFLEDKCDALDSRVAVYEQMLQDITMDDSEITIDNDSINFTGYTILSRAAEWDNEILKRLLAMKQGLASDLDKLNQDILEQMPTPADLIEGMMEELSNSGPIKELTEILQQSILDQNGVVEQLRTEADTIRANAVADAQQLRTDLLKSIADRQADIQSVLDTVVAQGAADLGRAQQLETDIQDVLATVVSNGAADLERAQQTESKIQAVITDLASQEAASLARAQQLEADINSVIEDMTAQEAASLARAKKLEEDILAEVANRTAALDALVIEVNDNIDTLVSDLTTSVTAQFDSVASDMAAMTTSITQAKDGLTQEIQYRKDGDTVNLNALNTYKVSNDGAISGIQTSLNANVSKTNANATAITGLTSSLNTTNTELGTVRTSAANAMTKAQTAVDANSALSTRVDSLYAAITDSEGTTVDVTVFNALKSEVSTINGTVNTLVSDTTALKSNYTNLSDQVSANTAATSSLATRMVAAEGSISTHNSDITLLRSDVNTFSDNLATKASNEAVSALTSDLSIAKGNITNQASDITRLKTSLNSNSSLSLVSGTSDSIAGVTASQSNKLSLVADTSTQSGSYIKVGANSGNDYVSMLSNHFVNIDPNKLYRVRYRYRRTQGSSSIYLGLMCANASKSSGITATNTTVANDVVTSALFFVTNFKPTSTDWQVGEAYFKGRSTGSSSGSGTKASPRTFPASAAYARISALVGYSSGAGEFDIDYITFEDAEHVAMNDVTASAVQSLTATVSDQGGVLSSHTNSLTSLNGSIQTLTNGLATKADSSALNNYYTKTENNSAIAGQISSFSAKLTNVAGKNLFDFEAWNTTDKQLTSNVPYAPVQLLPNTQYTISTNITKNPNGYDAFAVMPGSAASSAFNGFGINEPLTFTTDDTGVINIAMRSNTLNASYAKWIQIELGSVATSFVPHVNNVKSAVDLVTTANATAIQTTQADVATVDGKTTANSNAITTLQGKMSVVEGGLETKADSSALQALDNRVTTAEGAVTSQSSSITSLSNSLTTTNGNVTAAQNAANAANTLAGGKGKVLFQSTAPAIADRLAQNLWIDTTGNANTPRRWNGTTSWVSVTDKAATDALAAANAANTAIKTKADASALSNLDSKVAVIDGKVTSQASSITKLQSDLTATDTKAGTALTNAATAQTTANTAVTDAAANANNISSLQASLKSVSTDGANLIPNGSFEDALVLPPAVKMVRHTGTNVGYGNTSACYKSQTGSSYAELKFNEILGFIGPRVFYLEFATKITALHTQSTSATLQIAYAVGSNAYSAYPGVSRQMGNVPVDSEWVIVSGKVAIPDTASKILIRFVGGNNTTTGEYLVDAFKCIDITEAYNAQKSADANASAISTTNVKVENIDGKLTTAANDITSLKGSVQQINGTLSTKADATALNSYYTKTQTENVIAGSLNSYKASLVIGAVNLINRNQDQLNKMVSGSGSITAFANSSTVGYNIPVTPGEPLSLQKTTAANNSDNFFRYAFYKEDGSLVTRSASSENKVSITVPALASYFLVSYPTTSKVQLERGNVFTDIRVSDDDVSNEISANATAIENTNTEVTRIDGVVKSEANKVTKLQSDLTDVDTKAGTAINNAATAQQTANTAVTATEANTASIDSLSASIVIPYGDNAVGNPSFTEGLRGWVVNNGYDYTVDVVTDSVTSSKCMAVTSKGKSTVLTLIANGNRGIPVIAGHKYRFSCRYKAENVTGAVADTHKIRISDSSGNLVSAPVFPTAETVAWTAVSVIYTAGSAIDNLKFTMMFTFKGGTVYIDDCEFIDLTVSESLASKADASALNATNANVATIDGKLVTQANAITSLAGRVTTTENGLATKAEATALNSYYTKTQADEAITGQLNSYKAGLVIGGVNLISNPEFEDWTKWARNCGDKFTASNVVDDTCPSGTTNVVKLAFPSAVGAGVGFYKGFGKDSANCVGELFTASVWLKASVPNFRVALIGEAHAEHQSNPIYVTTEWKRYSVTAKRTSATGSFTIYTANAPVGDLYISRIQYERGTIATAWQPCSSDTVSSLAANANAIQNTQADVVTANGKITANSNSLTSLQGKITTVENGLATKANASALTDLTTRVSNAEGVNISQGSSITNLQNNLATTNTNVSKKADSSAVTTLDNKVTAVDGRVTTNANSITSLKGRVDTVESGLSTKAESSVLSSYYTKNETNTAIAGNIDTFSAKLVQESANLFINPTMHPNALNKSDLSGATFVNTGASDSYIPSPATYYAKLAGYDSVTGAIQVKPNAIYKIEADFCTTGANNANASLGIRYLTSESGTATYLGARKLDNYTGDAAGAYSNIATWQRVIGYVRIPNNALDVRIWLCNANSNPAWVVTNVAFTEYSDNVGISAIEANTTAITNTNAEVLRVDGRVTTTANDLTSLQGRVNTVENGLTTKANASALNDYYTKVQANDAIAGQITSFNANLEIGGVNLAIGTENPVTTSTVKASNTTGALYGLVRPINDLYAESVSKKCVMSFDWEYVGSTPGGTFSLQGQSSPWTNLSGSAIAVSSTNLKGRVEHAFVMASSLASAAAGWLIGIRRDNMEGAIKISNLKFEFGTKATSWSPSPQDVKTALDANVTAINSTNTNVSSLNGTVTSQGTRISSMENKVNSSSNGLDTKVSQTTFDTLNNKVTNTDTGLEAVNSKTTVLTTNVSLLNKTKNYIVSNYRNGSTLSGFKSRGVHDGEKLVVAHNRGLNLTLINADGTINSNTTFDTYAGFAAAVLALRTALEALTTTQFFILTGQDRIGAFGTSTDANAVACRDLLVNCGVPATLLPKLVNYTLPVIVGRKTLAQGAALIQVLETTVSNQWMDTPLTFVDGRPVGVGGSSGDKFELDVTTKALEDLSSVVNHSTTGLTVTNSKVVSLEATVNSTVNGLPSKVSTTAFDTLANKVNSSSTGLDALNSKTTALTTELSNLTVGGENIINGSSFKGNSNATGEIYKNGYVIRAAFPSSGYVDMVSTTTAIEVEGEYVTYSFDAKASVDGTKILTYVYNPSTTISGESSQGVKTTASNGEMTFTLSTSWTRYWVIYKLTKDNVKRGVVFGRLRNGTAGVTVDITRPKVELGTKATDWTESTGDIQNALSTNVSAVESLTTRLNTEAGKITANSNKIVTLESKVNDPATGVAALSTGLNDLKTTVNNSSTGVVATSQQLTALSSKVDDIKIGGVNTYSNVDTTFLTSNSNLVAKNSLEVPNGFQLGTASASPRYFRLSNVIKSNGWWTISGYARGNQKQTNATFAVDICDIQAPGGSVTLPSNDSWIYFSYSVNVTNYTADAYNFVDIQLGGWLNYMFKNIKVEEGNKATAWTPHPDDLQKVINSKASAEAFDSLKTYVGNDSLGGATSLASKVTALTSTVGNNTNSLAVQANVLDGVKAQYHVKMETNGVIGGFGLLQSTGQMGTVTTTFGVNADSFFIGAPASGKKPFIVTTSSKTINGMTYPAGTWIDTALIANATIGGAKIANASITNAQIADATITSAKIASLDATKITVPALPVVERKMVAGDFIITGSTVVGSSNLFDGLFQKANMTKTTYGTGDGTENKYIQFDLKQVMNVSQIFVMFPADKTYKVKFKISKDGVTWEYLMGSSTSWVDMDAATPLLDNSMNYARFTNTSGIYFRYLRVIGNGNNVNTSNELTQLIVSNNSKGSETIIDGSGIVAGSVTADKMSVNELSAISGNLGSIKVGTANIDDLSVTSLKIADRAITSSMSFAVPFTPNVTSTARRSASTSTTATIYGLDMLRVGSRAILFLQSDIQVAALSLEANNVSTKVSVDPSTMVLKIYLNNTLVITVRGISSYGGILTSSYTAEGGGTTTTVIGTYSNAIVPATGTIMIPFDITTVLPFASELKFEVTANLYQNKNADIRVGINASYLETYTVEFLK